MKTLLSILLLCLSLPAQLWTSRTCIIDASTFWASPGDGEDLLVCYAIGADAGKIITYLDPGLYSPTFIPVRMEPVWAYAHETRTEFLGMRPCFHPINERLCRPHRSIPLNYVVALDGWMLPLGNTETMPHFTPWRLDYPGGPTWMGGAGTPELTVVWFRVVAL